MSQFFSKLFDTSDFPPRWNCGNWDSAHGWLHIGSDLAISGAYFAIPITILLYLSRKQAEVFQPRLFWLFSAFIFTCGTTHLVEAVIFYQPYYRLSGLMKALTAVVSWTTLFALVRFLPQALELPGLRRTNEMLAQQVALQKKTRAELERSNKDLSEFTNVVQHDLRDPICSALFMAELAKETTSRGDTATATEQIDQLVQALAKAELLVNDLHQRCVAKC